MEEYWPDIDRSGQLCRDLARFWSKFDRISTPVANLKLTEMHPKRTRPNPANLKLHIGRLWVMFSPHLSLSGQVRGGHKPNPD